jgi:streptogramin lyase
VYALSASHRVVTVLHSDGTRSVVHIPVATSGGTKIIGGLGGEALNGMVTLPDGTTFIADEWRLAIIRIAPNGAVNMNWAFVSNPISALYSDAHGNLYSPDSGLTRVGANGSVTPNWLNAKQLPSGASPYSIAVSPGGTVFISRSDGFNADLFEVQSDHTLVRVATVKIGSFSLKVPPSIDFASSAFSVSASKALWALGQGAVGLVLPTGQVSTWWLTDSHGSVASTRAPFAVAANHTGYAVLDAGKATGAATTIVRFTLPTTQ